LCVVWKAGRATLYVNDRQLAAFALPALKNAHFGLWAQTEGSIWKYDNDKITD